MRRHVPPIALLIVLVLSLRLYHLGYQNLWIDEAWQVRIASQSATEIIQNYRPDADLELRDQAPLSLLVTHVFISANELERSVRYPAAAFGTFSVFALFLLAREFFSPPIPTLAALFLAVAPLHIWYSQDARWYAQWVCLMTFSYVALVRAWKGGGLGAWTSYALLSVLAIYTFVFSFVAIACQGVSAWLLHCAGPRQPRFLRRFILMQFAVTAVAAPVLWVNLSHAGLATGTPRPTRLVALGYTVFAYAAGFSLGPPLAYLHALPGALRVVLDYPVVLIIFALFVPLLALGVVRIRRLPAAAAVVVPWFVGPLLLIFLIAKLTNVTYEVRYTMIALPAFLLLLALGVDGLESKVVRRLAIGAVLACFAWSLVNYYWNPTYAKEDVRGALAYVTSRESGRSSALVVTVGQIDTVVPYYGRGLEIVSLRRCGDGNASEIFRRLPRLQDVPAFWLLVGRDWDRQAAGCLAAFSRSRAPLDHRDFAGVELWHLGRRNQTDGLEDADDGLP